MNKLSIVLAMCCLLATGIGCGWCQEPEDFSLMERQAHHRAHEYENEVKHLSHGLLNTKPSEDTRYYTTELIQRVNRTEGINTHLKKVSRVVVFLSFSMPKNSLESWLRQCKLSGATPVIRGLINNSFKETMEAIRKLSKKSGTGMQLDPILFQTFHIKHVPAVVFAKDIPQCPANMNCKPIDYDVLYGDVSLGYALSKINEAQPSDDSQLIRMINALEGALK